MRRLKPATAHDAATIAEACRLLRDARDLLRNAAAPKACGKARRALKSAEGAARHVQHRLRSFER